MSQVTFYKVPYVGRHSILLHSIKELKSGMGSNLKICICIRIFVFSIIVSDFFCIVLDPCI